MSRSSTETVVIIGAGIAGVSAALKLSEHTRVILLEKNTLFSGASGKNPGRMGLGFHYYDLDTAKKYLHSSIQVQKKYPSFLIGQQLPEDHPIRRGRYFITKTSNYSYRDVLKVYQALQDEYRLLVEQDPLNMVFGHPELFLQELSKQDYAEHINLDLIEDGVETCEHLFDWPKFKLYIYEILTTNPNISFLENTEVLDIQYHPDVDFRYNIICKQQFLGRDEVLLKNITSNFIINSAWQNIEYLNSKLGISYINGTRTNRLKCLLEVELPPHLKNLNSAFFCMGSFCMFSNMGNGRGMMTLADVTNMAVSSTLRIDNTIEYYLSDAVTGKEKLAIGEEILKGVALYIPQMIEARILDVKFGIVQTFGHLTLQSLSSRDSAHHKRDYNGIREEQQGLISNPAMKLFYFIENSEQIYNLFQVQLLREAKVKKILQELNALPKEHLKNDIKKAYQIHLDRWVMSYADVHGINEEYFLSLISQRHHLIKKLNREISLWENIKLRIDNSRVEWVKSIKDDSSLQFNHVYHSMRNIVKKTSPKITPKQEPPLFQKEPLPTFELDIGGEDECKSVSYPLRFPDSLEDLCKFSKTSIFKPIALADALPASDGKIIRSKVVNFENDEKTVSYNYTHLRFMSSTSRNIFDEKPSHFFAETSQIRFISTSSLFSMDYNSPQKAIRRSHSACAFFSRQTNKVHSPFEPIFCNLGR